MPNLPDPVIAALIAAVIALTVSMITLRTTRKISQQQLEQARLLATQDKDFQEKMALWSMKAGPWQEKLSRLNDLQRAAELTRDLAIKLKKTQEFLSNGKPGAEDIFMDYAGRFIVTAARVFAEKPTGVSNLPDSSVAPLKNVRRAVLRVNLLLEPTPVRANGHQRSLDAAVNELVEAVQQFTQCVAREEDELTPKNFLSKQTMGDGQHPIH